MKRPNLQIIAISALCGLTLLFTACTTPDLKPFADSTASLHQAVVQSHK